MNFQDWCYANDIKGIWRVALRRRLAEKHGELNVESAGRQNWEKAWNGVLNEATIAHPAIKGKVLR